MKKIKKTLPLEMMEEYVNTLDMITSEDDQYAQALAEADELIAEMKKGYTPEGETDPAPASDPASVSEYPAPAVDPVSDPAPAADPVEEKKDTEPAASVIEDIEMDFEDIIDDDGKVIEGTIVGKKTLQKMVDNHYTLAKAYNILESQNQDLTLEIGELRKLEGKTSSYTVENEKLTSEIVESRIQLQLLEKQKAPGELIGIAELSNEYVKNKTQFNEEALQRQLAAYWESITGKKLNMGTDDFMAGNPKGGDTFSRNTSKASGNDNGAIDYF